MTFTLQSVWLSPSTTPLSNYFSSLAYFHPQIYCYQVLVIYSCLDSEAIEEAAVVASYLVVVQSQEEAAATSTEGPCLVFALEVLDSSCLVVAHPSSREEPCFEVARMTSCFGQESMAVAKEVVTTEEVVPYLLVGSASMDFFQTCVHLVRLRALLFLYDDALHVHVFCCFLCC